MTGQRETRGAARLESTPVGRRLFTCPSPKVPARRPADHRPFIHRSTVRSASGPGGGLMDITVIIVVVIVTALAFDFTNGFHDTANAVATSIATGALKPRTAVLIAGVLNLVGAFLSVQVAKTISSGLVDDTKITPTGDLRRTGGGDRVEPADLAGKPALQF